jgi:hypothetical protein
LALALESPQELPGSEPALGNPRIEEAAQDRRPGI